MSTDNPQDTLAAIAAEIREICDAWQSDHGFPDGLLGALADRLMQQHTNASTVADKEAECERLRKMLDIGRNAQLEQANALNAMLIADVDRLTREREESRAECERLREQVATLREAFRVQNGHDNSRITELARERDELKRKAEGLAAALRSAHVAEGKLTDANSIGFRIGFAAAIAHIEGVAMGTATPATDTPPPADDARDAELDAAWKATGVAGTVRGMATLADVIATNRENAALDAEDARRYRWLRNESWCGSNSSQKGTAVVSVVGYTYPGKILAEEAMDAAVDAAMAKDGAT